MADLRRILRNWIPPVITEWIQRRRSRDTYFDGPIANWEEARSRCSGYNSDEILEKVLSATLEVKNGRAAYERDSVLFDRPEYEWPVLASLYRTALLNRGCLNVLDFGGALGSSFFQHRLLLDAVADMRWSVVEQEHFVRAGQKNVQDDTLCFYPSIEACVAAGRPNALLLSSVAQYIEDWDGTVAKLLQCGADTIILDRTIVNASSEDRIFIQHVPASIYPASYPCRSLSQSKLVAAFAPSYRLISDFGSLAFPALHSIESTFKGYLFERNGG